MGAWRVDSGVASVLQLVDNPEPKEVFYFNIRLHIFQALFMVKKGLKLIESGHPFL